MFDHIPQLPSSLSDVLCDVSLEAIAKGLPKKHIFTSPD